LIKERVQDITTPQMKFFRKLSTKCEGVFVEVREDGAKKWMVGQTREQVRWPDAVHLLEECPTAEDSSDICRPWKRRRSETEPYIPRSIRQRAGLCVSSAESLEVLDALVGTWHDNFGQAYKVTKRGQTPCVDVETRRPDAKGIPTPFKNSMGLVRIERMESMPNFSQIVWGRRSQFVLYVEPQRKWSDMDAAKWLPRKGRTSTFHWSRS